MAQRKMMLFSAVCAVALATLFSVARGARAEGADEFVMPKWDPKSPLAVYRASKAGMDDPTPPKMDPKLVAGQPLPASKLPAPPADGQMTFVFSDFTVPVYPGWAACPKGWEYTNEEQFLASLPNAEQARLLRPENEAERTKRWKADAGTPGRNVCTNTPLFPQRPTYFQVGNDISYGLDLDSDVEPGYTCAHKSFVSPLGEQGIDNQSYRASGCTRVWRGPDGRDGEIVPGYTGMLATGQFTVVMILRDVDSLVNDDKVEVTLASSDQQPIIDLNQNVLAGASFHVSDNPTYRNVLKGRIVDGVLLTQSQDILLERREGGGKWDLQRSKLRFAFRPDGSVQGLIGGYENLGGGGGGAAGTATVAGIDCAAAANTRRMIADGGRDPKTGKCTRISTAYKVAAVPAFIFDKPPEKARTAMSTGE